MAHFDVYFEDDFLSQLLETDFDEIAEEALTESVPILEASLKKSCASSIQHPGDSELVNSIRSWKPKKAWTNCWIAGVKFWGDSKTHTFQRVSYKSGGDHWIKVVRKYPVSNALKAIWKEYGIPGKQPPRPFISSACTTAYEKVISKMQEVYNRKVGADES